MQAKFFFIFLFLFVVGFAQPKFAIAAINLNEAFQRLSDEIVKNPDDKNLKMDLAYLYTQGFELERAVEIYKKVLIDEPNNLRAVNELCAIVTDLNNRQEALGYCQKATELDSDNYLVFDNLGLSYFKLHEPAASLEPFVAALKLRPDAILVRYHLAQSYMALGEFGLAREMLLELVKRSTIQGEQNALLFHGLYLVNLRLKNYEESYQSILQTYRSSHSSLFLGKVVIAFMKAHQFLVFCFVGAVLLGLSHYFGQRLNRFLKNE